MFLPQVPGILVQLEKRLSEGKWLETKSASTWDKESTNFHEHLTICSQSSSAALKRPNTIKEILSIIICTTLRKSPL